MWRVCQQARELKEGSYFGMAEVAWRCGDLQRCNSTKVARLQLPVDTRCGRDTMRFTVKHTTHLYAPTTR
jgi:hypothetical protein